MKKTYKTIKFFVVLLTMASMKLGAQALSGLYTINSGAAASSTNFQSFTAFATAINANGVSAAVTVDVVPGASPYVEQIQLNQITGMSAANKVTINGNNNLITFNASSGQPWTIALNGTDYLVVNNLQVEGSNVTYAYPLKLWNAANNNTFTSCSFSVPVSATSTGAMPISISGSGTSYSSGSATIGDLNKIYLCTTFGGYAGISIYRGTASAPYNQNGNNVIESCTILDFYYAGVMVNSYENGTKILYNTIKCPTRTTTTTKNGIYCYAAQNTMIEGNIISDLFATALQTSAGTAYGIYCMYNTSSSWTGYQYPSQSRNIMRNNRISDILFNGSVYGIYCMYYDGELYNNTISLDHTGSTATGQTYGIYQYGYQANYVALTHNNIVSITRGGSGQKYCFYNSSGTNGTDLATDRNNFYINSAAGSNNVAYYTGVAATQAALASQGANTTGFSVDPMYVTLGSNYHFTNAVINNTAIPKGLLTDSELGLRNQQTPDIGALESLSPLCSGTPSMTVAGPTYSLCPGETAYFGIGNLTTDVGYTFQWFQSSVSQVGPWNTLTPVSTTGIFYTAPNQTTTNWYSCVISCTAPGGSSVQSVAQVNIAGTTTSTVTYNEGFEGIGLANRLPNCSWSSPQIGASAKTFTSSQSGNRLPRTGSSYATFDAQATQGTSYYYTNGILMQPGITYSASMWYQTDFTGATNWTDLSILVGTAQSSVGLSSIASTGGPAVSPIYKALSNTFTVSAPGLYYVAIRATSSTGTALYLSWDDLKIEIPCTPTLNTPTVAMSISTASSVCAGSPVNLTASGANTYIWTTGATLPAITVTPSAVGTVTYMVYGTNTISGCTGFASQVVSVKPTPSIIAFALPPTVCSGKSTNLSAQGQGVASYNWNVGGTSSSILVSPTAATSYTVIGTGINGCSSSATAAVAVNPVPNVTGSASNNNACKDDGVTLTGLGATSYQWVSSVNGALYNGALVTVVPGVVGAVSYTVTGTDNNGCTKSDVVALTVNACTGLNNQSFNSSIVSVYPNPNSGVFTIELNQNGTTSVEIMDMTGRLVNSTSTDSNKVEMNINNMASGIYYVKVKSAGSVEIIKVVKQ